MSDNAGYVQIPPDSTGKLIDTTELTRSDSNVVERQRLSIGSSDGTLIEAKGGAMPVYSDELALLLKALIVRLDLLNAMIDSTYTPPDQLYR